MRRFPLSILRERLLRTGSLEHGGAWLVREPSPWQLPTREGRATEPVLPSLALLAGGEPLCFELDLGGRDRLTLGRDPKADITLPEATLSGTHLILHPGPGGAWMAQDAGSSNGSRLDGVPLQPHRLYSLSEGARLEAGGVRFTFHSAGGLAARLQGKVPAGATWPAPA